MSAYIIAILNVTASDEYDTYKVLALESVTKYGGHYIARGGHFEVLEGSMQPNRIAMIEFESVEAAKRWWSSPEYQEVMPLRQRNAVSTIFLTEGL